MKCSQFGVQAGRTVVYFHGAPGSPEECAVFDQEARSHGLTLLCLDRFSVDPSVTGEAYYRLLAEKISARAEGRPVDVIGFSIGAFVALQTCRHLGKGVANLHLVSAAAPLDAVDCLDAMAGKQVFRLAKTYPRLFLGLSLWQGLLARFFPNALFRLLFASATGADKALAAEPRFQSAITQALRSCFVGRVRGYARDVDAYVRPWAATLAEVAVPTHIWHGANDNWSPVQMADYLKSAMPACASTTLFDGLSHYSCLYRAVPEISRLLGVARDAGVSRG